MHSATMRRRAHMNADSRATARAGYVGQRTWLLASPVAVSDVYLDDGDGQFFSFELARGGRTVREQRLGAVRRTYHFTALGLAYDFDAARVRRWLARNPDCYGVVTERAADGCERLVARVPFATLLLALDCTCRPAWSLA